MSTAKTPKQERGIETRRRLLEIAEAHLREVGVRQFSTSVVVRRAEVSVGILYRYWESTEALIEEIAPGASHAWQMVEDAVQIIDDAVRGLENVDPWQLRHALTGKARP